MLPAIPYLATLLRKLPASLEAFPTEADSPIAHANLGLEEAWGLHEYVRANVERKGRHKAVAARNLQRLRSLVFISMVETFERFAKESAGLCVDAVASRVADDRLKALSIDARSLAAHFQAGSLGRALTEGSTWLDTDQINTRFKKVLALPHEDGKFVLVEHSAEA